MKKLLASVFAALLFLVSFGANAGMFFSVNPDPDPASAPPGGPVILTATIKDANMSLGAIFRVTFGDARLQLQSPAFTYESNFIGVDTPPAVNLFGGDVFLACVPQGAICDSGNIFSLHLSVAPDATPGPGPVPVTFEWYVNDLDFAKGEWKDSVTSYVTIEGVTNAAPEPGALALVGLGLVIMVGVDRRRRMHRG